MRASPNARASRRQPQRQPAWPIWRAPPEPAVHRSCGSSAQQPRPSTRQGFPPSQPPPQRRRNSAADSPPPTPSAPRGRGCSARRPPVLSTPTAPRATASWAQPRYPSSAPASPAASASSMRKTGSCPTSPTPDETDPSAPKARPSSNVWRNA